MTATMPERPFTFLPPIVPEKVQNCHFVVVGTGGTGGFLVQDLSRYLSTHQNIDGVITIIDGDVVEEKNLVRQNFFKADIGKNKAVVTAERYAAHFGIYAIAVPKFVETPKELAQIAQNPAIPKDLIIVIGCVDNNKTRLLIHKMFKEEGVKGFWVDAGNAITHGQSVMTYYGCPLQYKDILKCDPSIPINFEMPNVFDYHPEMLEHMDKLPTELSCAEHAISSPQTVFANRMASNLCLDFIYNIVECKLMMANGVWFNIEHQSFVRYSLTPSRLAGLIANREKLDACEVKFK